MRTRNYLSLLTVFAVLLLIPPTIALLCGKERWKVKVCKDSRVNQLYAGGDIAAGKLKTPTTTTVAALRSLPAPVRPTDSRLAPTETSIWTVEAVLTDYKEEAGSGDRDYHLALKDASGKTMIAEIPSPTCLKQTPEPLRTLITRARADFDARFSVSGQFKRTNMRVRITGVGFFDKLHGQRGLAVNGIELHPVIKIEFP